MGHSPRFSRATHLLEVEKPHQKISVANITEVCHGYFYIEKVVEKKKVTGGNPVYQLSVSSFVKEIIFKKKKQSHIQK